TQDDERGGQREPSVLVTHDCALRDGRVTKQAILELEWRDPNAPHLEEIVGAPPVPEVAVRVADEEIAGADEITRERALRLLVGAPVHDAGALTRHPKLSGLALGYGAAFLVEERCLVPGNDLADASGPRPARPVRKVDVVQLGGTDTLEHLDAVRLEPPAVHLPGQRLAGREAEPKRRQIALMPARVLEH